MTHIQMQNKKICHLSPLNNHQSHKAVYLIFLMHVAPTHHLHYTGQESKKQFAVCDSDIPVTLK